MNKLEKYQRRVMFLAIAFVLSAGLVMGQPVLAADVALNAGGLTIAPGAVANFEAMKVRIAGPSGDLVLDVESSGEAVGWSAAGMPDGTYRYEAVVLTYNPDLDSGEEDGDDGERLERTWGSLQVANGEIVIPEEDTGAASQDVDDQSFFQKLGTSVVRVAMEVMDLLVPSAYAVDLTASSGIPKVNYDDTDVGAAGSIEWRTQARQGGATTDFEIEDRQGGTRRVVTLRSSSNNSSSVFVDDSGDVRLANSTVFIDRSLQDVTIGSGFYFDSSVPELGIGTLAPSAEIDISAFSPEIELFDESDNSDIDIVYNSPFFTIEGDSSQDVFEMHKDAPTASLQITSTGDIGMGTTSPIASLEVRRSNGTAAIKVDENSGVVAKRQMFVLENNGALSFRLIDRNTNSTWQFDTTDNPPVGNFAINNVEAAGRELLLTKAGDMVLKGNLTAAGVFYPSDRNLKDNIEPLDGRDVLSKVMELPISSWSFKKDSDKQRHIGPMAQDFQKIFGGGPDDRHISAADSSGIALAAIQGLGKMVKARDAQIAELQQELVELRPMKQELAELRAMVLQVRQTAASN